MYHSEFYKNVVAVTNRSLCERPFLEQIERVCACHPKALILREKDLSEEEYFLLAKEVLGICRQYQVSCILHTYVEAARKLGHPCASRIHIRRKIRSQAQCLIHDRLYAGTCLPLFFGYQKGKGLGQGCRTVLLPASAGGGRQYLCRHQVRFSL